ncbi:hypothetical protein HanOQP8_Chr13g0480771 [Helianthus annuus]|nr:hypothetical protein HanOQP8_Chr13g0480771 [Helianthus annuus]
MDNLKLISILANLLNILLESKWLNALLYILFLLNFSGDLDSFVFYWVDSGHAYP